MSFLPFDTVRVARLEVPTREVSGSDSVLRQPAVGDEGAVLEIYGDRYLVECGDSAGRAIWLAEFAESELALVERAGSPT